MFYVMIYSLLSVAAFVAAWRVAGALVRPLLLVYCGAYVFTTLLGAVSIGLNGPDSMIELNYGLDTAVLPDLDTHKYWFLLFVPLILPPFVLVLLRGMITAGSGKPLLGREPVSGVALLATFALFAGYCILRLLMGHFGNTLASWSALRGDYMSLILLRMQMAATLGSAFFGILYITLPALSFAALYQYCRYRENAWLWTFLLTFAVTSVLCVWVIQKGLILIYLIFVGLSLLELKAIRLKTFAGVLCCAFAVLTTLQSFFSEDWTLSDSATLVIFRMASSFPYYASLYPEILPYGGPDLGLHLLGLTSPPTDALDVWGYMYPGADWVQGATPAPAHMRAYAEGGILYSVFSLVVIGVLLALLAQWRRRIAGPLSFAFYMQSLVCVYYLTQTSLRESVLSCYGVFWACVGLGLATLISQLDSFLIFRTSAFTQSAAD